MLGFSEVCWEFIECLSYTLTSAQWWELTIVYLLSDKLAAMTLFVGSFLQLYRDKIQFTIFNFITLLDAIKIF